MMGLMSALGKRGMRALESGAMFGQAAQAAPSPNAQALQGVVQRLTARGEQYGGGDIETLKSVLHFSVPSSLRRNPRMQSVKSVEELAALLDEVGADPSSWLSVVGI